MTVTAFLAKPDDWQSLRGWKNWNTGELALLQRGATAAVAIFGAGAGSVFLLLATDDTSARTFALVVGIFAALLGMNAIFRLHAETSIARLLRSLRDSPA